MREVKVFQVILGIVKRGDIHSGWLDPQLSSKYFYNYRTMDSYLSSKTKNEWATNFCLKHYENNLHITCSLKFCMNCNHNNTEIK